MRLYSGADPQVIELERHWLVGECGLMGSKLSARSRVIITRRCRREGKPKLIDIGPAEVLVSASN